MGNIRPEDDLAIDQEVNNEELLPVGAPKLPDFAKEMSESRNKKKIPKNLKAQKGTQMTPSLYISENLQEQRTLRPNTEFYRIQNQVLQTHQNHLAAN